MSQQRIYSKERTTAKGLYIAAGVLCFAALLIQLTDNWSIGLFLLSSPFLAMGLLLLIIGKYHDNKYRRLGKSVLVLPTDRCELGLAIKARVEIEKPEFNRVSRIQLSCLRRENSGSDDNKIASYQTLW
ncbi:hypothetical protein L2725_15315 [Shewanella corallii]|uniref:Uncharacterized protein n=1 Tax=Shewanella corallii TaxID=560080 RepID=A0ABT0N9K3_9GAMM|nr:hypothetical protein [Shewanella corallii]MCL2915128.1 hypothetical protein [Shewanella corallii]